MEHEEQQPTTARDAAPAAPAAPRIRAAGAQPSITAPANSIRPLRHGIDSLYVSYAGAIDPKIALALQELKTFAQSTSDQVLAQAIYREGDHRLTVLPHGRGRFAFVLEDNWFQIQVANACASALPLAHVQIRSEYLTAVGAEEALRTLQGLILSLGEPKGLPIISRVDLFVDFIGENDLALQPGVAWVKRCRKRSIHEEANRITGISFGAGNEVSARLYDKTAETAKTGKDFLTPLWTAKGWKPDETVWRMEFQARREALPEVLRGAVADALPTWARGGAISQPTGCGSRSRPIPTKRVVAGRHILSGKHSPACGTFPRMRRSCSTWTRRGLRAMTRSSRVACGACPLSWRARALPITAKA